MTQQLVWRRYFPQLLDPLRAAFHPQQLIPSVTAGLVTGIIGVIRAISYAALIFSGSLSVYLSTGIGMTVFSAAVVSAVVALTSALPGMIATPLAAPTAILAIMAGSIAQGLQNQASPGEILITVTVAIALTSFFTGSCLFTLGQLKLGDAIRFIPYPVVGGFMAGTGWLLVSGFFQVTTDFSLSFYALSQLLTPHCVLHWGVGLIFTLILLFMSHRFNHYLVMPGTLISLIGVFYLVLFCTQTSIYQARVEGWLLAKFPQGGLWQPLGFSSLAQVQWSVIFSQLGGMITVMLISLLSLVLSNSGIELVVGQDIQLNRELKAIGLASLASGFGSGMVGNQALPSTLLVHEIGGHSRLTGLFTAVPALAVLSLGSAFLSYFPKPILGCLLLYLGLSLLIQWLYHGWFKLPWVDYAIVWIILVTIGSFGFLQGILVGFILTVILFMYQYSHVDVAKEVLSGDTTRSNVERNGEELSILKAKGQGIFILALQGFLFFGTATYLLNQVKSRVENSQSLPVQYLIIDFGRVTGIDSSAVLSCSKILRIAQNYQIQLVFTNISPAFQEQLTKGGGLKKEAAFCHIFPDLDRGLEWCETQILDQMGCCRSSGDELEQHLITLFGQKQRVERFMGYLQPQLFPAQTFIYTQQDPGDALYFIGQGQVSVLLELPDGQTKRLQTAKAGNLLGEMRFYGKNPLSTSVVADTDCQLYRLSQDALSQMRQESPELAEQLGGYIIRLLCDSLARREQQLKVML